MPRVTMISDPHWQAQDLGQLPQIELAGEIFLFNPLSGQTHIVNHAALTVLETLQSAKTRAELIAELDPDQQLTDKLLQAIDIHLANLDSLGLIFPR